MKPTDLEKRNLLCDEGMSDVELRLCDALEAEQARARHWRGQCRRLVLYVVFCTVAVLALLWHELAYYIPAIEPPGYVPWVTWIDSRVFALGLTLTVVFSPVLLAVFRRK